MHRYIHIIHQLTYNLTWWQCIMALISDYPYRNLLILLYFLLTTRDGLGSQLLWYQSGHQLSHDLWLLGCQLVYDLRSTALPQLL